MSFHKEYSGLIKQLPPSLVQESWRRLTTRKRNPLSIEEVQSINPIVEVFLKHEIEVYNKKKQRKRHTPNSNKSNIDCSTFADNPIYTEAIDKMRQEFVKATKEKLLIIKEQKDKKIEQIRKDIVLEMAKKGKELFDYTLKKYIRDGTIYSLIHALEDMDGKIYSDRTQDA